MAILGTTAITLADWAARMDDNNRTAAIVEMLSLTNEVLSDMIWLEGNLPTGHKTTVRTGLPAGTWRLLNYGVPVSKSTTAQIVDTCGNLEDYAQIDKDIADLNGNTASFRMSEASAHIEGLGQQMAQTLFYGNTAVNPERFTGLAPRYNTVNIATAQSAANVIDAGGTGSDNTSIWIVTWGPNTAHGIFPMGKISGLQHWDLSAQFTNGMRVQDANGNYYQAYVDHFKWECGLTVRDWRYCVRIANIDVSDLSTGSAANLLNALIRGLARLPTVSAAAGPVQTQGMTGATQTGVQGRTVIYCNRTVRTFLDLQAMNKTNVMLQLNQAEGKQWTSFRGIPVRTVDAILNTETRVV
jgi:hypothetical protein